MLVTRLTQALDSGLLSELPISPDDDQDRWLSLLEVYDLHTAPVGERSRFQHHPAVAAVKQQLEQDWLLELEITWASAGALSEADTPERIVAAMRAVAAAERLPAAYRWLAAEATWPELLAFLALEGGPDGGFDDLVAAAQIGLDGRPKLELARNYWDEMGGGDPGRVHTELHRSLGRALRLEAVPRSAQPVEALERAALSGLLVTNRWLQPELLGALGLIELQAGPRCRLVLQALERLDAPADAFTFYAEHAEVDPIHGRDWVDNALVPLVAEHPDWGPRMVKGAWWRSQINLRFFAAAREHAQSSSDRVGAGHE